ncbi:MAG: DUF2721 domain-containing protein [Anaerolineales bacterium]|jgi:hypothetical protein|nr:DUF2721 domain-containing protein [Anaerolineales bacterium]
MDITVTTPALLFPAISLLLLAYTNRFLTLANLIRELHARYKAHQEDILLAQIKNLRYRVALIRNMQIFGVGSFFLCVTTMLALFLGSELIGKVLFGASLGFLLISLGLSLREVQVSVDALNFRLSDIENLTQ